MAVVPLKLTYDEIDDLIYYSRIGDLSSLQDSVKTLSESYSYPHSAVIRAAIDLDNEGSGSGSCLLHYPAANGNIEIVRYLLGQTTSKPEAGSSTDEIVQGQSAAPQSDGDQAESEFVNHRNISGNTPLHWAGMNGHLDIVKALLRAGANPEVLNAAGRDALVESEWSSKDGAIDCAVWMLKECGELEKTVGDEDEVDGANGEQEDASSSQVQGSTHHQNGLQTDLSETNDSQA